MTIYHYNLKGQEEKIQISQIVTESGGTKTVITIWLQFASLKVIETLSYKMTKHPVERVKKIV